LVLSAILGAIWGFIQGFIGFFVDLYNRLVGNSLIPEMMQAIWDAITTMLTDVLNWINDTFIQPVIDAFNTWKDDLVGPNGTITLAAKGIYDIVTTKIGELKTWWETTWGDIKAFVLGIFNDPDGIVQKVKTAIEDLATAFSDTLTTAINNFKNNVLQPLIDKLSAAWDKFKQLIGIGGDDTNRQTGGAVRAGKAYMVGEKGPEWFVPPNPGGIIVPAGLSASIVDALRARVSATVMHSPVYSGGNTVNNYYNVEVNPSYSHVQSEAGVYNDVVAALASVRW
jgi:hypothetical protein